MLQKRGIVTAAKMTGTVTVTIHRQKPHPLYRKSFRVSKKFLADPNGLEPGVGDEVRITECRPLSKRKRFKVTEILVRAERVGEIAEEADLQEAMHRKKQDISVLSTSSHSAGSRSGPEPSGPRAGPAAASSSSL